MSVPAFVRSNCTFHSPSSESRLALAVALSRVHPLALRAGARHRERRISSNVPGEGPPYVSRLHPRGGWPPMPERDTILFGALPALRSCGASGSLRACGPLRACRPFGAFPAGCPPPETRPSPMRTTRGGGHRKRHYRPDERYEAPKTCLSGARPPSCAAEEDVYQGVGFGRMFRTPAPRFPAGTGPRCCSMAEERPNDPAGDGEMPAGYTFLGQFIDHDVTLETTTDLGREIQGDFELKNAHAGPRSRQCLWRRPSRTPRLFRLPYIRVGQPLRRCRDGAPRSIPHQGVLSLRT